MPRFLVSMRHTLALALLCLASASAAVAQNTATITGKVTAEDGRALSGAQVAVTNEITGVQTGALTNAEGQYRVAGLRAGSGYKAQVTMIGFGGKLIENITLAAGETRNIDFSLGSQAVAINAIEVFAQRAIERRTPVAYTDVDKVQIERQLASRDIPMVLNTTPSVYATQQGGGAGDARINVRGFNQRNLGVMINGVPINDMENGWVYWSNWDGLGDATSSIQLQRGLSAVNLATPSIGGTLNIITDPAAAGRRVSLKQEFGNDGFLKTTAGFSTGLVNDKWAFMASGVRKTGDGIIDGTWTDAWAYYVAGTYILNTKNRFDLFAVGAPQMHGQRSFKQNIAAFSHEYAASLDDYDQAAFTKYPEAPSGLRYNQNFNTVSPSYAGKQYFAGNIMDRHDPNFLNEGVNHFHKPQINFNWYSQLNPSLLWSTVVYYGGGKGGGTGTLGSMTYKTAGLPSRIVDWDATIKKNEERTDGRSLGILRSSRNNQWSIGAISKLKKEFSSALTAEVGVDWRKAKIDHYRDVVDLLGGDYFLCTGGCASDFWTGNENQRKLGDQIDYSNTNDVNWLGAYAQSEYAVDKLSVYGMVGWSQVKYAMVDNFLKDPGTGQPKELNADAVPGWQIKGGGLYNLTDAFGVFVNAGYVRKVPIFDGVINDINTALVTDPKNEKFTSIEAGATYRPTGKPYSLKANYYYTKWLDRAQTNRYFDSNGEDIFITLQGLNQLNTGFEVEGAYQPARLVRFDAAASIGNWKYLDDVSGRYTTPSGDTTFTYNIYIKDLKVGDAPQSQVSYGLTVFPVDGLSVQAVGRSYSNYTSDYNPFGRTKPDDRTPSWKVPNYSLFELHSAYATRFPTIGRVRLSASVLNLFDKVYVQDALDNSNFNAFNPKNHTADDAEVFMGLPRTFVVSLSLVH